MTRSGQRVRILTPSTNHLNFNYELFNCTAFLACGSHLSGSLSEIEPKFFVTRYCHGSPIHYHRKLIGQKLERNIATKKACDKVKQLLLLTILLNGFTSNKYFFPGYPAKKTHVLALELLRLSIYKLFQINYN